jgi:ATP-dependent exoDNAse (exonuclease V) alpha subunit
MKVWVSRVKREFKDNLRDPMTGELTKAKGVVGSVEYLPLRLAYASTIHKSQGLTLDNVQIDFRDRFFGNPGMMYVALSRCRTPEGLRLVGSEEMMIKRTVVNQKVKRFL